MGHAHTPADDIVYDLVSIQYHALQAAQLYEQYAADAEGHDDVVAFIRECQEQDAQRAIRCHEFLGAITNGGLSAGTSGGGTPSSSQVAPD